MCKAVGERKPSISRHLLLRLLGHAPGEPSEHYVYHASTDAYLLTSVLAPCQAYMPLALYLASFFANFTMKAAADRCVEEWVLHFLSSPL